MRARLWLLPPGDFYRSEFLRSCLAGGSTWATLGALLLAQWGIQDIVAWPGGLDYNAYCRYARQQVMAKCCAVSLLERRKHGAPFSHVLLTSVDNYAPIHKQCLRKGLPWGVLQGVKSWCRIRAGLVLLGHRHKRRSQRRLQSCLFRNVDTSAPYVHVFLHCPYWQHRRRVVADLTGGLGTQQGHLVSMLQLRPGAPGFVEVVNWCAAVDVESASFWRQASSSQ